MGPRRTAERPLRLCRNRALSTHPSIPSQARIQICLTLHHWVMPRWVAEQGDWLNPDTVHQFLRYAKFVIEELGAFPDYWVTMNEPMVPAILGNVLGKFPPQRHSIRAYRAVSRSLLRAHAG